MTEAPYSPPAGPARVLHRDAALLVVEKQAGLLSVPGRVAGGEDCLLARLMRRDGAVRLVDQRVEEAISATDRHSGQLRGAVAGYFDQVVDEECGRLARKLGVPDDEEEQLRYGLKRVGNKLQHRIQRFLAERNDDPEAVALIRELLGL